jgi:four helix bundle protein
LNHLSIAQASLAEVETQLEIAVRLRLAGPEESGAIMDQATVLGKQLRALRLAVSKH